jgi:hydrogenase maturation protease
MTAARILVAGIGNIFLGDDAFGVEVVQRLAARPLPAEVRVVDFGIRGIDLTYALMDGYETVILVDAAPRGQAPGTLYVIEPQFEDEAGQSPQMPLVDLHDLNPMKVLEAVRAMGGRINRLLLVGCEPLSAGDDDTAPAGLSGPVAAAVVEAIPLIESLIAELLCGDPLSASCTTPPDTQEVGYHSN